MPRSSSSLNLDVVGQQKLRPKDPSAFPQLNMFNEDSVAAKTLWFQC